MNPNEVEFLGEQKLVLVIPNFSYGVINLLCGSFGPFQGGMPIRIPLWLALQLKQQQKCRIVTPDWMDVETLQQLKEAEEKAPFCLEPPSEHFIDEAHMIMNVASDDIPNVDAIRTAIKDLWDVRTSKLRSAVTAFLQSNVTHAQLNHVTLMELNNLRPMLPHALDQIVRIQTASKDDNEGGGTQNSQ